MSEHDEHFVEIDGKRYMRGISRARMRVVASKDVPGSAVASHATLTKAWAMQEETNPDLVWTQFVLDTEGVNENWDYMPRPSLMQSYGTAIYKPFNMDHLVNERSSMFGMSRQAPVATNTIFGVMAQANLGDADGNILSSDAIAKLDREDMLARPMAERVSVVAWAAMYSFIFPKTVADVVKRISDNEVSVSMERWIPKWDFLVWDGTEYQPQAHNDDLLSCWAKKKMIGNKPVYRRSLAFLYGGGATTQNPANSSAKFLGPVAGPTLMRAAAAVSSDSAVKNFVSSSDEIFSLFAVSLVQGLTAVRDSFAQANQTESTQMPNTDPNAAAAIPAVLDPTLLRTEVKNEVQKAMAAVASANDRELAIANTMSTITENRMVAENRAARAEAELKTARERITTFEKAEADNKAALTKATTDLQAAIATNTENTGKITKLETDLTSAKASLQRVETEKAIAGRVKRVEDADLPDTAKTNLKAMASKIGNDSKFEVSDEVVDANIKTLTEVYQAGKAGKAGGTGQQAPPAQGQASKDGGTTPPATGATGATPPPPNLVGALGMAQAIAGLGAAPADPGLRAKYAATFGCGAKPG